VVNHVGVGARAISLFSAKIPCARHAGASTPPVALLDRRGWALDRVLAAFRAGGGAGDSKLPLLLRGRGHRPFCRSWAFATRLILRELQAHMNAR